MAREVAQELRTKMVKLQQRGEAHPQDQALRGTPRQDANNADNREVPFISQRAFDAPQPPQRLLQSKAEYEQRFVQQMFDVDKVSNWPQSQPYFALHTAAVWDLHDTNAVERVLELLSAVHQNDTSHYAFNNTRESLRYTTSVKRCRRFRCGGTQILPQIWKYSD